MKSKIMRCLPMIAALAVAGCSSMTSIGSSQTGTRMLVKEKALTLPATQSLRGTSFGNYEFEARRGDAAPFYGILPLKFKGGHLALDILLFAPATFFNLRAAFPFYEIDVENGIIRYKNESGDPWVDYTPKPEETERARDYYRERAAAAQ